MSDQVQGPVMLAVTNVLRTPPARVGKITENFSLPRTVELRKLLAGLAGGFAGLFLWAVLIGIFTGHSFFSMVMSAALFAGVAVVLVSWSPLRGESFAMWLGLSTNSLRADRVKVDGVRVRAYIGVAPLQWTAAGRVRIIPGAVEVPVGSVDERGVPVDRVEEFRRVQEEIRGMGTPLPLEGFEEPKPLPRS